MRTLARGAIFVGLAALLGACSANSASPLVPNAAKSAQSVAASADGDFDFQANPPVQPFNTQDDASPAALPPPSVCVAVYGLACYTPSEIRTAYNVPSSLDGTGQSIVIIDAYGSPTIQHDLNVFDAFMGLPGATVNVVYPLGQPAAANNGWAGETSLDVEWAHAIAPNASITLAVSPTAHASDITAVEQYVVDHHLGQVVSMSYGASEPAIPGLANNKYLQHADKLFQQAKDANIAMIASAGDYGATNGGSSVHPEFPASDPLVTSVGGTSLFMSDTGAYQSETVWNDSVAGQCPLGCQLGTLAGVTGGAPSLIFKTPSYQQMTNHTSSRQVADVSYNAGIYTAVLVYMSFNPSAKGLYFVGGTSAGAPQWAGIAALANQSAGHPLGFLNQRLYNVAKTSAASALHDVTSGSNGLFGGPSEPAASGYDMPTGIGSPNVTNLIPALIAAGP